MTSPIPTCTGRVTAIKPFLSKGQTCHNLWLHTTYELGGNNFEIDLEFFVGQFYNKTMEKLAVNDIVTIEYLPWGRIEADQYKGGNKIRQRLQAQSVKLEQRGTPEGPRKSDNLNFSSGSNYRDAGQDIPF